MLLNNYKSYYRLDLPPLVRRTDVVRELYPSLIPLSRLYLSFDSFIDANRASRLSFPFVVFMLSTSCAKA